MIEESQYNLPRRKTKPEEPTEAERRKAAETLEYLESLPWRPHGEEW